MGDSSRFRTIKVSDPRFERDHLRFMTVKSPALGHRGTISVYVPPNIKDQAIPIVTLLHGVYGSNLSWPMGAGAHLTAHRMIEEGEISPMIVVMPSDGLWGDGSGYIVRENQDFEKWIVEDVLDAVCEIVPQAKKDSPHFISGLSMGGFGALRLGIKYSHRYQAVSAHSSITDWAEMKLFVEEDIHIHFPSAGEDNIISLLKKYAKHLPEIRFDCGTEDILLKGNRALHLAMQEMRLPHIYEEFSGGHEWSYWENHLKDTLRFFQNKYV